MQNNHGISYATWDCILPVLVHKDESSQLQVPQDDSSMVAVHHRIQHLSKQTPRLFLVQALPAAHVCVHVSMVIGQEDVQVLLTDHHILQMADVVVFTNALVGRQPFLETLQRENLQPEQCITSSTKNYHQMCWRISSYCHH